MNIWIIKTGEPMPIDGDNIRLFRAATIAEQLSSNGFNVIWWNADFYHQKKAHRHLIEQEIVINKNYKIIPLKSCGYSKSISIRRLLDHKQLERNFTKLSSNYKKPDLIFCAFPTIGLASAAVNYGDKNSIPVIIDIRDLWPDIFLERIFPSISVKLGNVLLYPFNRKVNSILNKSYAITAVSPPMLKWAEDRIKNVKNNKIFPFGYFKKDLTPLEIQNSHKVLNKFRVFQNDCILRVCLFATFNNSFDIVTVIEAAKRFKLNEIQFVFCGDGEKLEEYKILAEKHDNIFFTGWIGQNELLYIMLNSHIGLAPYVNSIGFRFNLTNKPLEYMSSNLAILTCVDGYLRDLIEKNECGLYYKENDSLELGELLNNLLLNPKMLSKMRENSKYLFNNQFEATHIYSEMSMYFKNIISGYK